MKEIIRHASKQGVQDVMFGMAHRGRLNMLVNVLGKNQKIFSTSLRVNIQASVQVT